MIAEERVGVGLRGLLSYVVFDKQDNTDDADESFFELQRPVERDPYDRRIELSNNQPSAPVPGRGQAPQSLAGLRSLPRGGLARVEAGPALLLPADALGKLDQRPAAVPSGLRRPGDLRRGEGGQAWSNVVKKSRGKNEEIRGQFIAGTLQGTPREMAAQAAPFLRARPNIKAPVVHYSLSLQAGDGRKTPEEWKPIVESFLTKIGYPLDAAWTSFIHDDTNHQHAHLVLCRSLGDGKVWNREFSAKRAIQATAEIEREFGLLAHDTTSKREKKRKAIEEKKFEQQLKKEGKTMSREHIKRAVDEFIESRKGQSYTVAEMRAGLAAAGVDVALTERAGAVAGVKFSRDGNWISGSGLGDEYKAQGLLGRGLTHAAAPAPNQTTTTGRGQQATSSQRERAIDRHNSSAFHLGQIFGRFLALPFDWIRAVMRMIMQMINFLLGRKEAQHGAPAMSLGRFDEQSGQFKPGQVPADGQPGLGGALAAMAGVEEDLRSVTEKVEGGKWSELLEHGPAPYQHKDGAKASYFARLRLPGGGETTLWGMDIERALAEAQANPGDLVQLERVGKQQVTVKEHTADGKTVEKTASRIAWSAEKAPEDAAAAKSASLSPEAQRDRETMREITVRWLRDRADYVARQCGQGSAEHKAATARLDKIGFTQADELKYQAWLDTTEREAGESHDDYIRRREYEWLDERLGYARKYPGGREQEIQQIEQRMRELDEMRAEGEELRARERQRG